MVSVKQQKLRDRLNEIIEEYGDLYFDLDEGYARIMDWVILLHMDVQKVLICMEKILGFINDDMIYLSIQNKDV